MSRPMTPKNAAFSEVLKVAIDAVQRLDEAGCTVLDLDIRGGTPVLRVDRAPEFSTGSTTVRRTQGAMRESVKAAPYFGAQIEWTQRDRVASVARCVR
jgi:hypothetical protein